MPLRAAMLLLAAPLLRSRCAQKRNGRRPLSQRPCEGLNRHACFLPGDFGDARHLEEIAAVEIHEQEPGTRIDHRGAGAGRRAGYVLLDVSMVPILKGRPKGRSLSRARKLLEAVVRGRRPGYVLLDVSMAPILKGRPRGRFLSAALAGSSRRSFLHRSSLHWLGRRSARAIHRSSWKVGRWPARAMRYVAAMSVASLRGPGRDPR